MKGIRNNRADRARVTRRDQSGRAAWGAIGLTWLILAGLVAWGALELRAQMRRQIESRDGQVLSELARVLEGESGTADDLEADLERDPQMVFLRIARWDGIVAGWRFDAEGSLVSWLPEDVQDPDVPAEALESLKGGKPFSRFIPSLRLAEVFMSTNLLTGPKALVAIPALEVYVPLRGETAGSPGGVAGFLIEAQSLAAQFRALDRQLLVRAAAALVVAMAFTGLVLQVVFRRLAKARQLVERRTEDLLRANQELSRSARIAALGAVTAHLVHGLKNPVSGLQTFMASRTAEGGEQDDDWREARAATQRMQTLIHDVVRVIREQETELEYEVPLIEVGEAVVARTRASGERRGVRVSLEGAPRRNVDNRTSGLLALMLGNLVENAIEATPEGGHVRLHLLDEVSATVCEVIDDGPGIAVEAQARLFQPQHSTKEGGSGLGLAITRQLALALGGDVRLLRSDEHGSTFRVELPDSTPSNEGAMEKDSSAVSSPEILGRSGA